MFAPLLLLAACASATALPCYTPSSSAFNASAFNAWLVSSVSQGASALCVAPGSYTLAPPAAGVRAHLTLPPALQGPLTLDFTGVELTCAYRHAGALYMSSWVGVTLRGLTLRYAQPPSNTAAIVAVNASAGTLDVAVEAGHPTEDFAAGTVVSCNLFDGKHRLRVPLSFDIYLSSVAPLPSGQYRLLLSPQAVAGMQPGQLLGCRIAGGAMTVTLDNLTDSSLESVALYGGPSFGFLESGGGGNSYTNISIRLPPPPPGATTQPLLSTSADGFHSAGTRVGPRITGADFTGMDDDGIAIHGGFLLVTGADAASGRVWMVSHSSLQAGDRLAFFSPDFAPLPPLSPSPAFAPTLFPIASVTRAPPGYSPPSNTSATMPSQTLPASEGYSIVQLAGPPYPAALAALAFDYVASNADAVGSGFALSGCAISNHRARGMLIKASHGSIEGCSITNSSLGGIIVTPELYWREASYAQNVSIAGNRIVLTSSGAQSYGGIALGAVAPGTGAPRLVGAGVWGHSSIAIENNTLVDCSYMPIWLNGAAGVRLVGNVLQAPLRLGPGGGLPHCCLPLPSEQGVAVYVQGVSDVLVQGNCVAPAPAGQSGLLALLNVTGGSTGVWQGGVTVCPTAL